MGSQVGGESGGTLRLCGALDVDMGRSPRRARRGCVMSISATRPRPVRPPDPLFPVAWAIWVVCRRAGWGPTRHAAPVWSRDPFDREAAPTNGSMARRRGRGGAPPCAPATAASVMSPGWRACHRGVHARPLGAVRSYGASQVSTAAVARRLRSSGAPEHSIDERATPASALVVEAQVPAAQLVLVEQAGTEQERVVAVDAAAHAGVEERGERVLGHGGHDRQHQVRGRAHVQAHAAARPAARPAPGPRPPAPRAGCGRRPARRGRRRRWPGRRARRHGAC